MLFFILMDAQGFSTVRCWFAFKRFEALQSHIHIYITHTCLRIYHLLQRDMGLRRLRSVVLSSSPSGIQVFAPRGLGGQVSPSDTCSWCTHCVLKLPLASRVTCTDCVDGGTGSSGVSIGARELFEAGHSLLLRARAARYTSICSNMQSIV